MKRTTVFILFFRKEIRQGIVRSIESFGGYIPTSEVRLRESACVVGVIEQKYAGHNRTVSWVAPISAFCKIPVKIVATIGQ